MFLTPQHYHEVISIYQATSTLYQILRLLPTKSLPPMFVQISYLRTILYLSLSFNWSLSINSFRLCLHVCNLDCRWFHLFFIFHCVYVSVSLPTQLYWALGQFPNFVSCEECCSGQRNRNIFSKLCFQSWGIDTMKFNFWAIYKMSVLIL